MEDLLQVGVITGTHGFKGEVKVFPTTEDNNRFLDLDKVYIETKEGNIEAHVEGVKFFKKFVFLKLKGYDDINDVEQFKRCPMLVTREDAIELEEDEYFIPDLIGMEIVDESGATLGKLTDVIQTGANDVYEVVSEEGTHFLLPAIKECILDVDMENNVILVRLMKGLV